MDLAVKDVRRHAGRSAATIVGVSLLIAIVLGMNGMYRGNIADGVWLINHTDVDLWVVERGRGGPRRSWGSSARSSSSSRSSSWRSSSTC